MKQVLYFMASSNDILVPLGHLAGASRLKRISDKLYIEGNKVYKDHGLPFKSTWFSVYYTLATAPSPLTILDIASHIAFTHITVKNILREMEAEGLVIIKPNPSDRRSKLVSLSSKGRTLLRKLKPVWDDIAQALTDIFTAGHPGITDILDRIDKAVDDYPLNKRVSDREGSRNQQSAASRQMNVSISVQAGNTASADSNKNQTGEIRIVNTTPEDLNLVYWLFEQAIVYQRQHGYPEWKGYEKKALIAEVEQQLQYKITLDHHVLAIFSVSFSDPATWGEWDSGNALFLHRVITHPQFKGQRVFEKVLHWALQKAREKGLDFIRIDTWTDNPSIIAFYRGYGFQVVAARVTPNSPELHAQNRNLRVTLMQLPVI
jgi:DNA-binding MarR family transcriptional regulator/ribosomal protein S18 acetylase RimI-like enzyme